MLLLLSIINALVLNIVNAIGIEYCKCYLYWVLQLLLVLSIANAISTECCKSIVEFSFPYAKCYDIFVCKKFCKNLVHDFERVSGSIEDFANFCFA